MAVIGKIIIEHQSNINTRGGEVLSDVVIDENYFQLRTYGMGDNDRKNGAKQNIQITRDKAIQLRKLLDKFIGDIIY